MTFHAVATAAEVPVNTARKVVVDGRTIALVRTEDGEFFAVDDQCSHTNVSLSEGYVDGCMIECFLHGSEFDLRTGEAVSPPAFIPIATYALRIEGDGDTAVVEIDPTPILTEPAPTA